MKDTEKVQILKDLINIPSVNGNEEAVSDYLVQLFGLHGIKAKKIQQFPGRTDLVAEIGDGGHPIIGLSGHQDTVKTDSIKWADDPFIAVEKDGLIYGLGASDMKSGLAEFVIMMIELKDMNAVTHGTLRFMATISEELTEQGAKHLTELGYADDLDALIISEPTGVPLENIREYFQGGAFIDPHEYFKLQTALETSKQQDGEQHFIVGAHKGWMTYKVEARGKSVHSSMPSLGVNAVDSLVQYYLAEKEFYSKLEYQNSLLGKTVYAPDVFHGGEQVNSVPDYAYEQVKVRTIPEFPNNQLIEALQLIITELNETPTIDLKLTVEYSEDPVINFGRSELTHLLQENASQFLKQPLPLPTIGVSLGTDASEFVRGNPEMEVVILGPGNTSAHQVNEYVDVQVYLKMIDLFKTSVISYLQK
ncbi:succinyl-diaminopimelate desuccinylase [Lentilactobacillus curieae]|uniref:Succinyl-diaminopimelate desuccinylase n=1 Tax=Lentilactobacillus curieae TaxID=1138822 RepID=A0A1S6QG89_9LACO|nr:M20/M25/M40 family metallo-hydrolase [Lentilactobacillus curieae]AQW20618.1 succinyl-diaminopimelate desuccinylase [Lentilactobacillus curieae]